MSTQLPRNRVLLAFDLVFFLFQGILHNSIHLSRRFLLKVSRMHAAKSTNFPQPIKEQHYASPLSVEICSRACMPLIHLTYCTLYVSHTAVPSELMVTQGSAAHWSFSVPLKSAPSPGPSSRKHKIPKSNDGFCRMHVAFLLKKVAKF